MIKLTKADKIIIATLEHDARCKEKDLAQACHLSKDSIRYRIRRLEREKIIVGYSCFVDYTKTGYTSYKLYAKFNGTGEDWKRLRDYLDTKPEVFCRFEAHSTWNLGIAYFARSLEHYYELERELLDRFGGILSDMQLCHMMDARLFSNRLFLPAAVQTNLFGDTSNLDLDDLDHALLGELHADSSQTIISLAEKLRTTIDTIKRHQTRLEKSGVIRAYTTAVNYNSLGYETYKVFISVKNYTIEAERKILATLELQPQLRNYIRMIGPWKIEVEFLCASYDELNSLINMLQMEFPGFITGISYAVFRNEVYYPSKNLLN